MSIEMMREIREAIIELGGETLKRCMACGLCSGLCPWGTVGSPFVSRKVINMAAQGMEGFEDEDVLFACTTCSLCVDNCPRKVELIDGFRAIRTLMVETGSVPPGLRPIVGATRAQGNPWSGEREDRFKWAEDLNLPLFDGGQEYFLSLCCTNNYDPRGQKVARALIKVLEAAGISYGVIGPEESCCGESIGKIGSQELYESLANSNIKLWREKGVKKILTVSPHCYTAFADDYGQFGGDVEVVHYTQLLGELLADGKLELKPSLQAKVIYHDPCYLGRHQGQYAQPREALAALSETTLMEFPMNREWSMCCGGGGGRIWMETLPEKRFSEIKTRQAAQLGAEVMALSCPYCLSMFEDAVKQTGNEQIACKDIIELVAEAL